MRATNAESALGAIRFIRVFAQLNFVGSALYFTQENMITRIRVFNDAHVARPLRWPLNAVGRQVAPELHSTTRLFTQDQGTAVVTDVLKRNLEKNAVAARKRQTDHQMYPIWKLAAPSLLSDVLLHYKKVEINYAI